MSLHEKDYSVQNDPSYEFSLDRIQILEDKFKDEIQAARIPGAVIFVSHKDRIKYFEALGCRGGKELDAMKRDSIFCIASITKLFTSVAAMLLAEQGQLHLAQPVSRYIPKFRDLRVAVDILGEAGTSLQKLIPAHREMTIQDLMRHTSGLTYGEFGSTAVHRAYVETKVFDWEQTNEEMVEKLSGLPLAYHPGTTFEYSVSTDVLGHIIELVSGSKLDVFIRDNISKPLDLNDTGFHLSDEKLKRLALPSPGSNGLVEPHFNLAPPQNSRWISGGGGLFSTASDVYRFMQMLLNGGQLDGVRILSPKTVQLMTADHLPPNVKFGTYTTALQMAAPMPEMGQGFGLGFAVRTDKGRNPLPGSVGDYYWCGISGTYAWVDPVEKLVAVLMTRAPYVRVHYRALIRQLVYQALI